MFTVHANSVYMHVSSSNSRTKKWSCWRFEIRGGGRLTRRLWSGLENGKEDGRSTRESGRMFQRSSRIPMWTSISEESSGSAWKISRDISKQLWCVWRFLTMLRKVFENQTIWVRSVSCAILSGWFSLPSEPCLTELRHNFLDWPRDRRTKVFQHAPNWHS